MPDVCLYFQAHQPNRLREYTFFDIGRDPFYEDDALNRDILDKVAKKCYLPANAMFKGVAEALGGEFRMGFSLSGVFIEQMEHHRPDALQSFVDLVETGCVEMLSETYYHAMCYRASGNEFKRQVGLHREAIERHFDQTPRIFRHTELVYFNELAHFVEGMGFDGMLAEGVPHLLDNRSPNHVYRSPLNEHMKTLTRNCTLSDDLGFRFNDTEWKEYPLTPEKFADWVAEQPGDVVSLFIDYETIGEHHWEDTGIFRFWRNLPAALLKRGCKFLTPSEVVDKYEPVGVYDVHDPISWADKEKDLSAWKGNNMQTEAMRKIRSLEKAVKARKDPDLLHQWSKMQTSDHFYYMCTKADDCGAVHEYFTPYPSAYEGYIYFMNALSDLQIRAGVK